MTKDRGREFFIIPHKGLLSLTYKKAYNSVRKRSTIQKKNEQNLWINTSGKRKSIMWEMQMQWQYDTSQDMTACGWWGCGEAGTHAGGGSLHFYNSGDEQFDNSKFLKALFL